MMVKKLVKKFKNGVDWIRGFVVLACLTLCVWLMTFANVVQKDYSKKKKKKKKK